MADLSFDDLIQAAPTAAPAAAGAAPGVSFDDLIQQQVADAQVPYAVAAFNSLPWPSRLGTAADDVVRLMANGATFGFADKAAGYVGGEGTEAERAKSQAAHERAGLAGTAAEITGAVLPGLGAYNAGLTASRLVPEALTGIPGFLGRTAASAADAAGYGALSAAGHDQDIGQGAMTGAAIGAAAGPVAEGVGALANKLLPKGPLPATVDVDAAKQAARAAYKAADDAGIIVRPEGIQQLASDVKQSLFDLGYHPALQPKVGVAFDVLDDMSKNNVTLKGLDVLRQVANAAKTDADPSTRNLGREFVSKIDDYLGTLKSGDVLSGNRTEGVRALLDARKLWQAARKAETVNEAVEIATNNAAAAGSGGNLDNALRQEFKRQFKDILKNPKLRKGWSPDEIDSIRTIVRGTSLQNMERLVGKLSPQGNGLMLLLHGMGGMASSGATLPLAGVGAIAKRAADSATSSNVYALARIIAQGGDASKVRAAQKAAERLSQTQREALARVLGSWGVSATAP